MKLKKTTEYAICCLLAMANKDGYVSRSDISEATGVSIDAIPHTMKIMQNAGLVKSSIGTYGGFALAKDASDITLYDVIRVYEGEFCFMNSVDASVLDNINGHFKDIETNVIDELKGITLNQLAE